MLSPRQREMSFLHPDIHLTHTARALSLHGASRLDCLGKHDGDLRACFQNLRSDHVCPLVWACMMTCLAIVAAKVTLLDAVSSHTPRILFSCMRVSTRCLFRVVFVSVESSHILPPGRVAVQRKRAYRQCVAAITMSHGYHTWLWSIVCATAKTRRQRTVDAQRVYASAT